MFLQLKEFNEVKASVLQVTRSPGKKVVYLGCLLLTLGVFAMFYIRERRVWVWLRPDGEGKTHAMMAMSTQRKTLDFVKAHQAKEVEFPPILIGGRAVDPFFNINRPEDLAEADALLRATASAPRQC